MLRLVMKDISVGRYHILGMFLVIPVIVTNAVATMATRFGGVTPGILLLVIIFLCSIFTMLFVANERAGREEMLIASLPVSRFTQVLARYVSAFLMAAAVLGTALLTFRVSATFFHVPGPVLELFLTPVVTLGTYAAICVLLSYSLPFLIGYRPEQVFLRMCALPVGLLILAQGFQQTALLLQGCWSLDVAWLYELFSGIQDWVLGKGKMHPLATSALTALLAAAVSCFAAGVLFRRKEL
jgi:hypothetical protein